MELEKMANEVGNDKARLKKRLLDAKSCLLDTYRKEFKKYKYDFNKKRLIGSNGYFLQWQVREYPNNPESYYNQQTSVGVVLLFKTRSDPFTFEDAMGKS